MTDESRDREALQQQLDSLAHDLGWRGAPNRTWMVDGWRVGVGPDEPPIYLAFREGAPVERLNSTSELEAFLHDQSNQRSRSRPFFEAIGVVDEFKAARELLHETGLLPKTPETRARLGIIGTGVVVVLLASLTSSLAAQVPTLIVGLASTVVAGLALRGRSPANLARLGTGTIAVLLGVGLVVAGFSGYRTGRWIYRSNQYEFVGRFVLYDDDFSSSPTGARCGGTGGYSDIHFETPVVIRDEKGTILETTELTFPKYNVNPSSCSFRFDGGPIPQSGSYTVEVSHRGPVAFSFEQVSDGPSDESEFVDHPNMLYFEGLSLGD